MWKMSLDRAWLGSCRLRPRDLPTRTNAREEQCGCLRSCHALAYHRANGPALRKKQARGGKLGSIYLGGTASNPDEDERDDQQRRPTRRPTCPASRVQVCSTAATRRRSGSARTSSSSSIRGAGDTRRAGDGRPAASPRIRRPRTGEAGAERAEAHGAVEIVLCVELCVRSSPPCGRRVRGCICKGWRGVSELSWL